MSSISLAGQDPAPRELFLPILVNGVVDDSSHFQTVFRFVETSGTTITPAVSVALEMFDNDGGLTFAEQASCPPPVPVLDPIRRFDLAGWASLHFGTKGFMQPYEPDVGVNDGWARIRWSGPGNLSVVAEILAIGQLPGGCPPVICFRPSTAYRSDALIEPQLPALEFHSPAVISRYRHAAFSIVNPAPSATANVYLELYDQSGALVRRGGTTALSPMHRASRFAWEWATVQSGSESGDADPLPAPEQFYGSARIVSDAPVVVGGVQVLFPEGRFVSLSVAPTSPTTTSLGCEWP